MVVTITPTPLKGELTVPPSKSQAHRLIIAAALSHGDSVISNVAFSQDIMATLGAMERLGAQWERIGDDGLRIRGLGSGAPVTEADGLPHLDCWESGSTLRFLIPVSLAVSGGAVFTGRGRLMERPQKPYFDLFDQKGISYTLKNNTLTVRGELKGGDFLLPGDVSSQFFTGLLFTLPLLDRTSIIRCTTVPESRSYINMTMEVLKQFGVEVYEMTNGERPAYLTAGQQKYRSCDSTVEGDWSQAAFYYAAMGMGNALVLWGLDPYSCQGDRVISDYCRRMRSDGEVILRVGDCPDLVPPLAVQAALRGAGNVTRITDAARLRMKESDRLTAVTTVLNTLGAQVEELPDGLVITGVDALEGGVTVDPFNDHRIAMMTAIGATRCRKPVTVLNAECVRKSYPNFWEDYEALGGIIRRED